MLAQGPTVLALAAALVHGAVTPVVPLVEKRVAVLERPAAHEQRAWSEELSAELQLDGELVARGASPSNSSSSSSSSGSASASTTTISMPQPFDEILNTNFTSSSCPQFFQSFLHDSDFQACSNMWMLIQTSTAFFHLESANASTSMVPILDKACSPTPGESFCAGVMGRFATAMQQKTACGKDLSMHNPLATTALQGFLSYSVMRDATCAKDNSTQQYCFAQAAMASTPDDLYVYQLPAGTSLPSNYHGTCSACTADLLGIFSNYAQNSTLAISGTYADARSMIATTCGPAFAPRIVGSASQNTSSAVTVQAGSLLVLFAGALLHLLF